MENKKLDISSAKAVLLGALTPGVNGPTWNTLKSVFLMLGACLAVMLGLAFSSSDSPLILHVGFLVLIAAALFLLLSWFLSQIGLVSVEHQMQEIDCVPDKYRKFDLYLHDYLVKRNLHKTAAIFRNEANVGENPVAVDSFDGFLHEWWTLFYDVYASRQLKHEEAKTKSSVKGGQMTQNEIQNMRPVLPKLPIYQQRCGEFPVGPGYGMLGQPPTCLLPTRMLEEEQHLRHPISNSYPNLLLLHGNKLNLSKSATISPSYQQQEFQNQAQLLTPPRNVNSIIQSNPMDTTLHEGVQEGVVARPRSHAAALRLKDMWGNKQVNPGYPSPSNGLLSNSLMQTPSQLQQFPMLAEQHQQNQLSQFQPLIFGNLTSAFPGSSANFDGQNLILPESNMNGKNAELIIQMKQTEEHRHKHDQHLQQQLPEIHKPLNVMNVPSCFGNSQLKPMALCNLWVGNAEPNIGFAFEEIGCLHSSKSKVLCCHFSSDGRLLASAGHDKKVSIWNMQTFDFVNSSEGHSLLVTDVRFRPNSTILATSSFDRTLQIWDASKPSKPLFKLLGHADQVMALDFHPRKVDLLCSCDSNDEIRLWNVNRCACTHQPKGATKQVRFQPQCGKLLATSTRNNINVIDVENDTGVQFNLKGHAEDVLSLSWDISGKYIASSLELWNPIEGNKTWSVPAHSGLIAALADSPQAETIASASHDQCVKLWK
ncbi:hypothetical protein GH714_016594 [Hevea brasiliensis]|uniref:LisH domain-containing protein n=1 Tax=Hevea brasiliensis TaxID=3981 RepID=A0A6A6LS66_HEVBR|nr:hypothetical protein GH714_016594 [Hevea brasiliensis]